MKTELKLWEVKTAGRKLATVRAVSDMEARDIIEEIYGEGSYSILQVDNVREGIIIG